MRIARAKIDGKDVRLADCSIVWKGSRVVSGVMRRGSCLYLLNKPRGKGGVLPGAATLVVSLYDVESGSQGSTSLRGIGGKGRKEPRGTAQGEI